jgi:hypothetical protein
MRVRATMEAMMRGQIGQPIALTMSNKRTLPGVVGRKCSGWLGHGNFPQNVWTTLWTACRWLR